MIAAVLRWTRRCEPLVPLYSSDRQQSCSLQGSQLCRRLRGEISISVGWMRGGSPRKGGLTYSLCVVLSAW